MLSRHSINWVRCGRVVKSLQARIVKAGEEGRHNKVKALQWLLTRSFSGRVIAVRRVTENRGRKTPGTDGETWDTPQAKLKAAGQLARKGYRASPLRRVKIPKANGKMRAPGIPTMKDRAMQALYKLALEPAAETAADRNSYGFRPKRSCADAADQCHRVLSGKNRPEWLPEGDIKGCFDHISHEWMSENIPTDKKILKEWLKAGFIENGNRYPTEAGTPQGGIISPVLANMTLDGLETELGKEFGIRRNREGHIKISPHKINMIRYADDFIITGNSEKILREKVKPPVAEFLTERGLALSEEKTRITHVGEGFDFLGQNVRKYDGKVIIKPAKKNIGAVLTKIRQAAGKNKAAGQENLIRKLNPIIRGWANYHRHIAAKDTFRKVDRAVRDTLRRWTGRRHRNKSAGWIRKKYFTASDTGSPEFAAKAGGRLVKLFKAADVRIKRHAKIRSGANPYKTGDREYFMKRDARNMKEKSDTWKTRIWKNQKGICPICKEPANGEREWHIHHIDGNHGNNKMNNLILLHTNCHRLVHSRKSEVPGLRPKDSESGVTGSSIRLR